MFYQKYKKIVVTYVLLLGLLIGGVVLADVFIYGGTNTINENPNSQDNLGATTAVPGVCSGNEETTQLCNVNAYALQVGTDLTVDDDFTLTGSTIIDSSYFQTDVVSFTDATVTPCAILNDDGADRWVMTPFAAVTGPATTTLTFTFATSTTPYRDRASTAVVSMKVSTSTETAIGLPSYNSNSGIASGVFKWPDATYLLLNVTGENATLEKAAWETNNTLAGKCVVQYIKE